MEKIVKEFIVTKDSEQNESVIISTIEPREKTELCFFLFDDDKEYELTKLGQQFVHYTMNEVVPKIEYKTV